VDIKTKSLPLSCDLSTKGIILYPVGPIGILGFQTGISCCYVCTSYSRMSTVGKCPFSKSKK